ncbi:MAG: PulJ/GspJ family protein [Planctomycetota bacterium]
MTLVEMLVATALSLLIVLAVTQVFRVVGDNVLSTRAVAEMSSQLRATSNQLRRDLGQLTVPVRPWTDYDSGQGYFEYHEGPASDMRDPTGTVHSETTLGDSETPLGDYDDILMFTAKSQGTPFTGQIPDDDNPVIESNAAEIAWFTSFNDRNDNNQVDPGEITLHRRVLLVKPELNITHTDGQPILDIAGTSDTSELGPREFYHLYDISVGYRPGVNDAGEPVWIRFANSLQNLSLRENRTAHFHADPDASNYQAYYLRQFPYPLSRQRLAPQGTEVDEDQFASPMETPTTLADAYGQDVIQSQLLAFDVQAYDPEVVIEKAEVAPSSPSVSTTNYESVLPDDPGYGNDANQPVGRGGYVDLFYSRYASGSSVFSGRPHVRSGLWPPQLPVATYDTWTMFYEHDGVPQDERVREILLNSLSEDEVRDRLGPPHGSADWGTDGIDNNNDFGVDDVGERETSPPYPVPLRGIRVRMRIMDPDSRQVRQVTVSSDFIPE